MVIKTKSETERLVELPLISLIRELVRVTGGRDFYAPSCRA